MNSEKFLQFLLLFLGVTLLTPLFYLREGSVIAEFTFYGMTLAGILGLWYGISSTTDLKLSPKYVLGTSLLLFLVTLPVGIFIDTDVYRHIWDGLIQAEGENPYAHSPQSGAWMGMRAHEVYGLLNNPHFFSASSPAEMVIHRFVSWLEPLGGLNALIIGYKLIAIASGLGIIYLLIRMNQFGDAVDSKILLFAWNPVIILMIASQGALGSLALLTVVGCLYLRDHPQQEVLAMVWGISLHFTLVTWLLLPWLARNVRWSYLLIALGTWAIWWLPFFDLTYFSNYISGLLSYHLYPGSSATPGFLLAQQLLALYPGSEQWATGLLIALLGTLIIYRVWHTTRLSDELFLLMGIAATALWFILPAFSATLPGLILVLAVLTGRHTGFAAIASSAMVLQIIALRMEELIWLPPLIFSAVMAGAAIYWLFGLSVRFGKQ